MVFNKQEEFSKQGIVEVEENTSGNIQEHNNLLRLGFSISPFNLL